MSSYVTIINWFHVLVISPLFIYIGSWYATQPSWLYWILACIGIIVIFHHYSKVMRDIPSPSWVSILHSVIIGPLLLWVGLMGKQAPEFLYPLLAILGWGAGGYHGSKLLNNYL